MAVRQTELIAMLGMGDSTRDINKVLPEYTAMMTDIAVGYESGIAANYGSKFDYRLIEGGLVIQSGGCWAFGYAAYNRNDVRINLAASGGGTRYVFIYVEFDLTGSAVNGTTVDAAQLVVFDNGGNSSFSYQQDNLRTMKTGKYQLPLYRIAVTDAGITGDSIQDLRTIREKVKNAERADFADKVDGIVAAGTMIENGVTAVTQARRNSTRNVATTAFVMAEINDVKNITQGVMSYASGFNAAENIVKRQVNFVYGRLSMSVTDSNSGGLFDRTVTLPEGFRPKTAVTAYALTRVRYWSGTSATFADDHSTVTISPDGQMRLSASQGSSVIVGVNLCFGFEITE